MERRFGEIIAKQQAVIEQQQAVIRDLEKQLELARADKARLQTLETEVARLTRELIGRKTEKTRVKPVQRELAENEPERTEEEAARRREEIARKRRERALAKDAALETKDVEHPLPPELKACPSCGGTEGTELPPEITTTIEYVPGHFVRRRHKRQKMVRACQCEADHIVTAPGPEKLLRGGLYGPSFGAFLIVEKCADSTPIYRIERRFERLGIPVSRGTMNALIHACAERLQPLANRVEERMKDIEVVLADETSVRLQDRPQKRGFMWVFHGKDEIGSGGDLVLYKFALDRSGTTPVKVLGGSEGTLVVDGYTGYNDVVDPEQRERGGCWSHGRRKFFESLTTAPDEAQEAITQIRELFRVEHEATLRRIVGTSEHLALRHERSAPAIEKLYEWLLETKGKVLPKSPLATAIGYCINQKDRLRLFLTDARIPIHNNASERRLRVIALGRKNFLFFGDKFSGQNFAGLYSLVGSCIANGVEPTEYLTDVLLRVRHAATPEALDALLPDRWCAPEA
jgi:transposase